MTFSTIDSDLCETKCADSYVIYQSLSKYVINFWVYENNFRFAPNETALIELPHIGKQGMEMNTPIYNIRISHLTQPGYQMVSRSPKL